MTLRSPVNTNTNDNEFVNITTSHLSITTKLQQPHAEMEVLNAYL